MYARLLLWVSKMGEKQEKGYVFGYPEWKKEIKR